jgi:CRP-like cAMP-binding protein
MQFSDSSPEASHPLLTWQRIADWAQTHYRGRIFGKDERIPARQGLLYLVNQGTIRLVGQTQTFLGQNQNSESFSEGSSVEKEEEDSAFSVVDRDSVSESDSVDDLEEAFLGFVSTGQPFEIVAESFCSIQAYAHVEETEVFWLYWHDLDNWPHFRQEIYEILRYQHQRKLLWLSALGQRKTIERLMAFLTLLVEEYGETCKEGCCLPYPLTHAQIGSTIGSTRVTVTRLMGKLRRQGAIIVREDNLICLPLVKEEND